jgi:tetratricopeptide (TPR) repeat protein
MRRINLTSAAAAALLGLGIAAAPPAQAVMASGEVIAYTGSSSCRPCHERFYQLWSTSHHGLAMQPFTAAFAREELRPASGEIAIGEGRYLPEWDDAGGRVRERDLQGEQLHEIAQVMGGKNVYFFLTPLERGHLQVLPVAYDVRRREWYDTTASMIRHVAAGQVDWRDRRLTFNTSCFSCHVSQLSTNYDAETDSYHTTWSEPGINCETCHGPAAEHVRVCTETPSPEVPSDLRIIRTRPFSVEQTNSLCAPCHAKMAPITASFSPGELFFDHFHLATLEDPDFYPDGRDLGENYTYTQWLMSPCVQSGQLDCMHCHTSSGRFRFRENPDQACMPCHQEHGTNVEAHTHHPADSPASRCIACHMPMTEFARMRRSDHSMRPPAPAATVAFGSPNACNLCHTDQTPEWSDHLVREWRERDYQGPIVQRGRLIEAARVGDWSNLPQMLAAIASPERDEVFATSLIRLLAPCDDDRKWPVIEGALDDPSPLVRAAAAEGLAGHLTPESVQALLGAAEDDVRLVRVRAADALAGLPPGVLDPADMQRLSRAAAELEASYRARPDDWSSHYNQGNTALDRGDPRAALAAYEVALRLSPHEPPVLVNAAMAQARLGDLASAEASLQSAIEADPQSAPAHFNMGLLAAEQGDPARAERALSRAFELDPHMAEAAHNLGILLAESSPEEALEWHRRAAALRPADAEYGYTLGFYLQQSGEVDEAVHVLQDLLQGSPASLDASLLLARIHVERGHVSEARVVLRRALEQPITPQARTIVESQLRALGQMTARPR